MHYKLPRIHSGPCNMKFKEWIWTMALIQFIPFLLAAVRCYHYYFTHVYDKGQDLILTVGIVCTIHVKLLILLLFGIITRNVIILSIWMYYNYFEALFFTIIALISAGYVFVYTPEVCMGVIIVISAPVFACFFIYCILTIHSFICDIEEKCSFLTLSNPMYDRSQIQVY